MRDPESVRELTSTTTPKEREESSLDNLTAWIRLATPKERAALAAAAGTSVVYLYQMAAADGQAYKRGASAAMAGRIERAAAPLTRASKGRLPTLVRTDLCAACRDCEYAQRCLGSRAVESDFKVLSEEK